MINKSLQGILSLAQKQNLANNVEVAFGFTALKAHISVIHDSQVVPTNRVLSEYEAYLKNETDFEHLLSMYHPEDVLTTREQVDQVARRVGLSLDRIDDQMFKNNANNNN